MNNRFRGQKLDQTTQSYDAIDSIGHFNFHKYWIHPKVPRPDYLPKSDCPEMNEPVDAVYTWVNGSDPEFLSALEGTTFETKVPNKEDMHNQRFEGNLHR